MRGSTESSDPQGVDVRTEERGSTTVVHVTGEVDMLSAAEFVAAVLAAAPSAPAAVEVDLRGVTYFGSEGVQGLVRGESRARERGLGFAVRPSPIVARCLEVSGLSDLTAVP